MRKDLSLKNSRGKILSGRKSRRKRVSGRKSRRKRVSGKRVSGRKSRRKRLSRKRVSRKRVSRKRVSSKKRFTRGRKVQVGGMEEELRAMKLSAVRKRAKEVGVEEDKLVEADDADDIKEAVIQLILAASPDAERLELEGMKISALRKRAEELGASEKELEDADDADDIKVATIEIILRLSSPAQEPPSVASDMDSDPGMPPPAAPPPVDMLKDYDEDGDTLIKNFRVYAPKEGWGRDQARVVDDFIDMEKLMGMGDVDVDELAVALRELL